MATTTDHLVIETATFPGEHRLSCTCGQWEWVGPIVSLVDPLDLWAHHLDDNPASP